MAAAAWSCVEKMLQLVQVTSAPSSVSVSMSTAVWMVMCRQPAMRAPLSGLDAPYSLRRAIRPGISLSAMPISLRPQSASLMSLTLKFSAIVSVLPSSVFFATMTCQGRCLSGPSPQSGDGDAA